MRLQKVIPQQNPTPVFRNQAQNATAAMDAYVLARSAGQLPPPVPLSPGLLSCMSALRAPSPASLISDRLIRLTLPDSPVSAEERERICTALVSYAIRIVTDTTDEHRQAKLALTLARQFVAHNAAFLLGRLDERSGQTFYGAAIRNLPSYGHPAQRLTHFLAQHVTPVDCRDATGKTPLYLHLSNGIHSADIPTHLSILLQRGASLLAECGPAEDDTPLRIAYHQGWLASADFCALISDGFNQQWPNPNLSPDAADQVLHVITQELAAAFHKRTASKSWSYLPYTTVPRATGELIQSLLRITGDYTKIHKVLAPFLVSDTAEPMIEMFHHLRQQLAGATSQSEKSTLAYFIAVMIVHLAKNSTPLPEDAIAAALNEIVAEGAQEVLTDYVYTQTSLSTWLFQPHTPRGLQEFAIRNVPVQASSWPFHSLVLLDVIDGYKYSTGEDADYGASLLRQLIERGADPNLRQNKSKNAVHQVLSAKSPALADAFFQASIEQDKLPLHGFDKDLSDNVRCLRIYRALTMQYASAEQIATLGKIQIERDETPPVDKLMLLSIVRDKILQVGGHVQISLPRDEAKIKQYLAQIAWWNSDMVLSLQDISISEFPEIGHDSEWHNTCLWRAVISRTVGESDLSGIDNDPIMLRLRAQYPHASSIAEAFVELNQEVQAKGKTEDFAHSHASQLTAPLAEAIKAQPELYARYALAVATAPLRYGRILAGCSVLDCLFTAEHLLAQAEFIWRTQQVLHPYIALLCRALRDEPAKRSTQQPVPLRTLFTFLRGTTDNNFRLACLDEFLRGNAPVRESQRTATSADAAPTFNCSICFDTKPSSERTLFSTCLTHDADGKELSHNCCRDCTAQALSSVEAQGYADRCMTPHCAAHPRLSDLQTLPLNNQQISALTHRIIMKHLADIPRFRPCTAPDCIGGDQTVSDLAMRDDYDCALCGHACRVHDEAPADRSTVRALLAGLLPHYTNWNGNGITRECYGCGAPTLKGPECMHMHCSCGKDWDFDYGVMVNTHWDQLMVGGQRFRPLKDGILGKLNFYEGIPHGPLNDAQVTVVQRRARLWLLRGMLG